MVKTKLLQPQEIEVFYVIPALRKHLAVQMKANGLKQREIATLLGIEDAAVSQYINNKRGDKIKFEDVTSKEIARSAVNVKDPLSFLSETQRLLQIIRKTGALCKIHKQISEVPLGCSLSTVGCHHSSQEDQHGPNARLLN